MATHFSLLFKGSGLLARTGVFLLIMKTPSTIFEKHLFCKGETSLLKATFTFCNFL